LANSRVPLSIDGNQSCQNGPLLQGDSADPEGSSTLVRWNPCEINGPFCRNTTTNSLDARCQALDVAPVFGLSRRCETPIKQHTLRGVAQITPWVAVSRGGHTAMSGNHPVSARNPGGGISLRAVVPGVEAELAGRTEAGPCGRVLQIRPCAKVVTPLEGREPGKASVGEVPMRQMLDNTRPVVHPVGAVTVPRRGVPLPARAGEVTRRIPASRPPQSVPQGWIEPGCLPGPEQRGVGSCSGPRGVVAIRPAVRGLDPVSPLNVGASCARGGQDVVEGHSPCSRGYPPL
jgi:hypothetical protein